MKSNYSEVLENYLKISKEQGFNTSIEKIAKENVELSDIEILYGINQDSVKKLLEEAHPTTIVISPSHDKMNGVIENLQERQNVMIGIALKPTTGYEDGHIYVHANQELLNEVVKIGFAMDREDQAFLMKLADTCAENIVIDTHQMKKVAWTWSELVAGIGVPAAVAVSLLAGPAGWAVGGAALVAFGLMNNFGGMIDQGVTKNCDRAMKELQDVIDEGKDEMKPAFDQISNMIVNISYIKELGVKALSANLSPSDATPEKIASFKELIEDYKKAISALADHVPSYIEVLKAHSDMGAGGDASSNPIAIVKTIWRKLYPEEVTDAITALGTLQDSLKTSGAMINKYEVSTISYLNKNKDNVIDTIDQIHNKYQLGTPITTPNDSSVAPHKYPADHWQSEGNTPGLLDNIQDQIKANKNKIK